MPGESFQFVGSLFVLNNEGTDLPPIPWTTGAVAALLSIDEMSARYGISRTTVYRHAHEWPHFKVGKATEVL